MRIKRALSITLLALLLIAIPMTLYQLEMVLGQDKLFVIVGVVARSSTGSPKFYPGSRRVNLRIEAMYTGNETAYSVTGRLSTPEGISFSVGSGPSAPARSLDGSVATRVEGGDHVFFEYYLDVSKALRPGAYSLYLNITYRLDGRVQSELHEIKIEVSYYPAVQLRLVEAYLSPASYPGSVNTNLYVVLENSGESSIVSASFTIVLPRGFIISNPRASVGAVGVGERFTLRFSGVSVPQNATIGVHNAVIHADLSMRTEDNVQYSSIASIPVTFGISDVPREDPIVVSSVSTLYQGSPAPLLPSARDVTIRVYLINRLPDAIGGMAVTPRAAGCIKVKSLSGTYVGGMPPGGSCFIDLVVDVDEGAKPGLVNIPLEALYIRVISDASYIGRQSLSISVVIESPHMYLPEIRLVSAYWGTATPSPTYAGSRYVPLTLRFVNDGRYDIVGATIEASSEHLRPIKSSEALAARLASGMYSEVTLYFDVDAGAGEMPLSVRARYIFEEFGTHIEVTRDFVTYLLVEEYPAAASYLNVIGYGWQNNYSVFPRTENATLYVTIANRAPFPVSGIVLHLNLPENMTSRGERVAKAYVEGPVRSLSTFTALFPITVGDVKPGRYRAELMADFILQSGGPGIRRTERFSLEISVNDDGEAVEFIGAGWHEGSVGPYTYGARLIVSIRNNLVDSMRGPVLEIVLPRGFVNAADNSSLARATPLALGPIAAIPQIPIGGLAIPLAEYLRIYQAQQAVSAQAYGRGDILAFMFTLHVLDASLGVHNFEGALSYIDQWGTRRSIRLSFPVAVLGRTGYISVRVNGTISVRSRFTNATLTIENYGTSPLFDIYLIVSPYQGMPLLIASPAVAHIGRIGAGEKIDVPLTLAYNPLGFMTQVGGTTVITYGPTPLMISVICRDAGGFIRRFNNTVTVIIEPFIDLLVRDVRASGRRSLSTVSGVITNFGSATAYRVRAVFTAGNLSAWSLVGDIAPADEIAFRIEVPGYAEAGILTIEYYDIFNQRFSTEIPVRIELQPEAPAPPQERGLGIETWVVVGAVIVFLAIAFFLIYRVLRSRSLK